MVRVPLEQCVICKEWMRPGRGIRLNSGEVICPRPEWNECHERSMA